MSTLVIPPDIEQSELPSSPWSHPAHWVQDSLWRQKSEQAIACVLESIGEASGGSSEVAQGQGNVINRMISALFFDFAQADPEDRADLLTWLGRAATMGNDGPKLYGRTRGTVNAVTSLLMSRWAAAGWLGREQDERPSWAAALIEGICKDVSGAVGVHDSWESIRPGQSLTNTRAQTNAQADLLTFLMGYHQQAGARAMVMPLVARAPATPSERKIAPCCVALRILDSTTTAVDSKVLYHLNFFEKMYDHAHMDQELLRLAGAADDRKTLEIVTGSQRDDPRAIETGAQRRRTI